MVIVSDDETEVNVFSIVNNLNRRSVIVRTGPNTAAIFFEQDVVPIGPTTAFSGRSAFLANNDREFGIGEHRHAGPFREVAIDDDRVWGRDNGVVFFAWFDVVGERDVNATDC